MKEKPQHQYTERRTITFRIECLKLKILAFAAKLSRAGQVQKVIMYNRERYLGNLINAR